MKRFLSILLAVMMVLSTVSFAIPTAVTIADGAPITMPVEEVIVPEEVAELSADDTWYDIEKGTLLFNMDFETDNSGNAVAASAYDAISLGSYSAGAGELVSGLGRLNPDVAGNYDMGFRYTSAGTAAVVTEGGNSYFSVNSSGSNQFSLYLGNTFTGAGKYVLEYDYKVTSSAAPNYIQYNVPSNGNDADFTFGEWASSTSVYELTGASNAARVIFYAKSNYATTDTLFLDNIKVWYYDESVDYESKLNPPVEVEDTWYDLTKGTLLYNADFDVNNDGKAVSADAVASATNAGGSFSAASAAEVSGFGRLNPDVKDAGRYSLGFRYATHNTVTVAKENSNKYMTIAPGSSDNVSFYLGNAFTKAGKYVLELKYKYVPTEGSGKTLSMIDCNTPSNGAVSDVVTGEWGTFSKEYTVTGATDIRLRFMVTGGACASTDTFCFDDIKVWYYDESVDYDAILNPVIETNDVWEDEEKGQKLFTIDFTAKNDKKALNAQSWDTIKNRLDNNPTTGELVSDLGRINPDVDGSNYRISINYIDNTKTALVKDGDNTYLEIASESGKGDISLYLGGIYDEAGTYIFETSYKFAQTGENAVAQIRYETLGVYYSDASYLSTGEWVNLSEVHEHDSCSHGNVNRLRICTSGYANTPYAENDRIYLDNITVYYKAPEAPTTAKVTISANGNTDVSDVDAGDISLTDGISVDALVALIDTSATEKVLDGISLTADGELLTGTFVPTQDTTLYMIWSEPAEEVDEWANTDKGYKLFVIDFETKNDGTAVTASDVASITNGRCDSAPASAGVAVSAVGRVNPNYNVKTRVNVKGGSGASVAGTDNKYLTLSGAGDSLIFGNVYVGDGTYIFEFDTNTVVFNNTRGSYAPDVTPEAVAIDGTWFRTNHTAAGVTAESSTSCSSYHNDNIRFYCKTAPTMYDNITIYYQPTGWKAPGEDDDEGDDEEVNEWIDNNYGEKLFAIDLDGDEKYATADLSKLNNRIDGSNDNSASNGLYLADIGRTNPDYASYEGTFKYSFKDGGTPVVEGTSDKYFKHTASGQASVMIANPFVGAGTYTVTFNHNANITFSLHSGYGKNDGTITTTVVDDTWATTVATVDISAQGSDDFFRLIASASPGAYIIDDVSLFYKPEGWTPPSDGEEEPDEPDTPDEPVVNEWAHDEYGKLIFDVNFDGTLATEAQSRWASIMGFGAKVNPEHPLKDYFKSMWGTEDIGDATWIPATSSLIVKEANGNRYYTQPHAQVYNEFAFYAPYGGDYAIWEEAGVFTITYDVKVIGDIDVDNHFIDPNLSKNCAVTKTDIRFVATEKANKTGWTTLTYQFDVTDYTEDPEESLGKLIIYTQTAQRTAVANAYICYDNIRVYYKPSKVNVTLNPDTNLEVAETVVPVSTKGVLVSDLLANVNTEDTTLMAKGIRNEDSSVVLSLTDTLYTIEDATYYIIWEENSWSDSVRGMLIMNGNFEGDFLTTPINRWPAIDALGASRNPEYNFEGITGLQFTTSNTGIALDGEGKWIPSDYKKTENLNSYISYPISSSVYGGEGYTNFNAYAMGKSASQYQYQGAGIYTVSAKIRFPENLKVSRARVSLNAYNGNGGIVSAYHQDHADLAAGQWHEISATWVTDADAEFGLGSAEIYLFYEQTSEKINIDLDDFKIYYKPFTANITLRANNNPIAKDIVIENVPTSGIAVSELIAKIRNPLGGMDLVGLAYDKAGTKMVEENVVIGGDARFFMIWKDSELDPNAPVAENVNAIRTDDPIGMRFRSYITNDVYNNATKVGWVVTRYDMLEAKSINSYDFYLDTDVTKVFAYNKDTNGTNKVFDADDVNTYIAAVLYNIPEKHYATTLVARPFTVVDGVTYYGYPIERSIYEVAVAIRDGGYAGCSNDQIIYINNIIMAAEKTEEEQEELVTITLEKTAGEDFVVLNIADPQMSDSEWESETANVLRNTVDALIAEAQPDLITVTGDISVAGYCNNAYKNFADLIDSYDIPWAVVWGNHDNESGAEKIQSFVDLYKTYDNFIYDEGPAELGNGNYVISIEQNGTPVHALVMMDTHDKIEYDGIMEWGALTEDQLSWYETQIKALQKKGCNESSLVIHTPLTAYKTAYNAAYNYSTGTWNDGYEAFGVNYEGICCHPVDYGAFDLIKSLGSTKLVLAGHDHYNCASILYQGVRLTYALKTGTGNYCHESLNGGTVVTIDDDGKTSVRHIDVAID